MLLCTVFVSFLACMMRGVYSCLPGARRCCTCHRTPCRSLLRCRGSGTRRRLRPRRIRSPGLPPSRWRGSCCHGTASPGPPWRAPLSARLWAPPLEDKQGQNPTWSEKPQQTAGTSSVQILMLLFPALGGRCPRSTDFTVQQTAQCEFYGGLSPYDPVSYPCARALC